MVILREMPNTCGSRLEQRRRRRQQSGESSASSSSVSDIPNPIVIPLPASYPNYDHIPNPWDTPEYEALCRADRERADRERVGPQFHSDFKGRVKLYPRDTYAGPKGWDNGRPKPTPENVGPEWCGPPLFGLNCSICGSSQHTDICCAYLMDFPPDGHLLNNEGYEIVCQCGRTIVQGGCCPSGYCYSDRPMRVVKKYLGPFGRPRITHVSLQNSSQYSDPYPIGLGPTGFGVNDGYPVDMSFAQFCEVYPIDPNLFA